jgi:hypothetical protein
VLLEAHSQWRKERKQKDGKDYQSALLWKDQPQEEEGCAEQHVCQAVLEKVAEHVALNLLQVDLFKHCDLPYTFKETVGPGDWFVLQTSLPR